MSYIIRLVLMGEMCLYYLVHALDQNAITSKETNAPYEKKIFVLTIGIAKKDDVIFDLRFLAILRIVEEN